MRSYVLVTIEKTSTKETVSYSMYIQYIIYKMYYIMDICLSYAQHPPKLRAALFALTFSFSLLTLRSSGVRRALPSFSFGFHSLTLQAKV